MGQEGKQSFKAYRFCFGFLFGLTFRFQHIPVLRNFCKLLSTKRHHTHSHSLRRRPSSARRQFVRSCYDSYLVTFRCEINPSPALFTFRRRCTRWNVVIHGELQIRFPFVSCNQPFLVVKQLYTRSVVSLIKKWNVEWREKYAFCVFPFALEGQLYLCCTRQQLFFICLNEDSKKRETKIAVFECEMWYKLQIITIYIVMQYFHLHKPKNNVKNKRI